MIISHKYKFIFIKTKKTAGTSIEIALSKFLGDNDIITPITPEDEQTRARFGFREPQNCVVPIRVYSLKHWRSLILKRERVSFFNHMSASCIKALVDRNVWETYFKFCFERNPWDKVVSWYFWEHRTEPRPSISEFIESGGADKASGLSGIELYSINDKIAVDRVCFYEKLEEEIEYIANRVRLPEIPQLPKAKSHFRQDDRSYREILSEEDKHKVAKTFAEEIAAFGYVF